MAELVDALGLGPSAYGVGVRVPSPVPLSNLNVAIEVLDGCDPCLDMRVSLSFECVYGWAPWRQPIWGAGYIEAAPRLNERR